MSRAGRSAAARRSGQVDDRGPRAHRAGGGQGPDDGLGGVVERAVRDDLRDRRGGVEDRHVRQVNGGPRRRRTAAGHGRNAMAGAAEQDDVAVPSVPAPIAATSMR